MDELLALARDLVATGSRGAAPNLSITERTAADLAGFGLARLDNTDAACVAQRALVAHRRPPGALALCCDMDTAPATG